MNANELIIESKIKQLNIDKKDTDIARDILNTAGFDMGGQYLEYVTQLKKTAQLRYIDFNNAKEHFESEKTLIKFVQSALKSFDKIVNPDNKKERALIQNINNSEFPIDDYLLLSEKKKDYKQLIKQKDLDFNLQLENQRNAINNNDIRAFKITLELQNDDIEKAIIESNSNKLKRTVLSKKYQHLVNKETDEIFLEAAKQGITKEQMRESVSPKIAAMKNPQEFNELIGHVIGLNIVWDANALEKKAIENNTNVLKNEDGIIHLEIDNFSDSQTFGSRMWCITRDNEYLTDYLFKSNTRIVFQLDTNLDIKDKNAYVAMLYQGEKLNEVYDKNDTLYYSEDELFQKIKTIELPEMNESSKVKKIAQLEGIVTNGEDFNMTNQTYLNLVSLKAFDLLDFYEKNKDNGYYEWTQFNLYSSEQQQRKLEGLMPTFDKEQIEYIANSKSKELLSCSTEKTHDVLLNKGLKSAKDSKQIDYLLNRFSQNEDKSKTQYQSLNGVLSNPNSEVVEHFLSKSIDYGINVGKVFSSKSNKQIPDDNIVALLNHNPNIIDESMELNNKVTFINLFSNNDRSEELMVETLKSKTFDKEEHLLLINKFSSRIEKTENKKEADISFSNAIQKSKNTEKRPSDRLSQRPSR